MTWEEALREDVEDWQVLLYLLPEGWREKARELGALRRAREFESAGCLLQALMLHLVKGYSLEETALRTREAGLADVSAVAIWKRLKQSGEWFRWMAEAIMKGCCERLPAELLPGPYRLRLVDATTVSKPGSTGTDWRIHYAVDLGSLRCDAVTVTDSHVGETFKHFPVQKGDLLIGDRVYANAGGIGHVVAHGGDALVRLTLKNLPLRAESGEPFALLKHLQTVRIGAIGQWPCWIETHGKEPRRIAARVCAVKRTRAATELARRKLLQDASRKGTHVQPETLQAAAYVFVLTTLPARAIRPAALLEVYRGRWQIELVFKRLKSLLALSQLLKHDAESARAWLNGKLFVAFLIEALIHMAESFSPWGYRLVPRGRREPEEAEPLAGDGVHVPSTPTGGLSPASAGALAPAVGRDPCGPLREPARTHPADEQDP